MLQSNNNYYYYRLQVSVLQSLNCILLISLICSVECIIATNT